MDPSSSKLDIQQVLRIQPNQYLDPYQVDCNENSPPLHDYNQLNSVEKDDQAMKSTFAMESLAQSDSASDPPSSRVGRSDSPEDALNNDFFYDDEFTIPFDANLAEGFGSHGSGRISLSCRSLTDLDDNNRWCGATGMNESKSDSCLYQADLELTDSEHEMSMSEHECVSSSDMSDIRHQPLFSNSELITDEVAGTKADNTDSFLKSCLSVSQSYGEEGSGHVDCYNWSLNKKQYFLSFDRSPTKTCSSGDECKPQMISRHHRSRITNWAKTTTNRKNSKVVDLHSRKLDNTMRKTGGLLTTWQQVKQSNPTTTVTVGLTSWQRVLTDRDNTKLLIGTPSNYWCTKSKEIAAKGEFSSPIINTAMTSSTVMIRHNNSQPKPVKLINLYKKMRQMKNLGLESGQYNEAMTSQVMLDGLIEPWPTANLRSSSAPGLTLENMNANSYFTGLGCNDKVANMRDRDSYTRLPASKQMIKKVDELELHKKVERANISTELWHDQALMIDRCIQTSLQLSGITEIHIETANKSLQTSLQRSSGSRDNSGHTYFEGLGAGSDTNKPLGPKERMLYSAYLLSKPLPDLSFLNKNLTRTTKHIMSTEEILATEVTNSDFNLPITRSELCTEQETCTGRRLIFGEDILDKNEAHETQPLRCRSVDFNRAGSSSSDSRESSPCPANPCRQRSRSSDSASSMYSACSTSSSGIDPGSYDSSNSRSSSGTSNSSSAGHMTMSKNVYGVESNRRMTPQKPPRTFPTTETEQKEKKLYHGCRLLSAGSKPTALIGDMHLKSVPVITVCNICHSRNVFASEQEYTKAMAASHPMYEKSEQVAEKLILKKIEYLQISPIHSRAPKVWSEGQQQGYERDESNSINKFYIPPRLVQKRNVLSRSSQLQSNNKAPAKSILVTHRQKNQTKHRSWFNPLDTELTSNKLSRPISLPEDILITHGNDIASLYTACASGLADTKQSKQSWYSLDGCVPEEDSDGGCMTTGTVQDSKLLEDIDVKDYDRFRAKKSVSFSEKIFYHSSSAALSPLESPDLLRTLPITSASAMVVHQASRLTDSDNTSGFLDMKKLAVNVDDQEMPPADFMVSPNISPPTSLSGSSELCVDIAHKRELVLDVMQAVETLLKYFSQTRDHAAKVKLGSTADSPDVGRLVLEHLCPAIHAIILDGLKPHVHSLFGRVKNSAWKFVEDSAEMGQSVDAIQQLLKSIKSLKFLNTPWLIFNAFIFGLLNYKAVDFWLTYVHTHKALLARHYMSNSFLMMSTTSTHRLFLDLITSLQPLAQMPLRLEYHFEHKMLEQRQQAQLSEFLLNQHVSRSLETYIEGQQVLTQWQNLSVLNTTSDDQDITPIASDSGQDVRRKTKELLGNTRRHLRERLGEKHEQLTTKGITIARNMLGLTTNRRPRPLSLPGHLILNDGNHSAGLQSISIDGAEPVSRKDTAGDNSLHKQPEILESVASDSSTGSSTSLWQQFARQIKDATSIKERVYKKSSTDVCFEKISPQVPLKDSAVVEHAYEFAEESEIEQQNIVNSEDIIQKSCVVITAENLKNIVSTEAIIARSDLDLVQTVQLRNRPGRNEKKNVGMNRWSDFGTHLVNWVDKLLLSDSVPVNRRSCESVITQRSCDFGKPFYPALSKSSSVAHIHEGSTSSSQPSSAPEKASILNENFRLSDLSFSQLPGQCIKIPDPSDSRFVYALCHYLATDSQQLSFEKGTLFAVVHQHDADWLQCRHGDQEGLVHIGCVKDVDKDDRKQLNDVCRS